MIFPGMRTCDGLIDFDLVLGGNSLLYRESLIKSKSRSDTDLRLETKLCILRYSIN